MTTYWPDGCIMHNAFVPLEPTGNNMHKDMYMCILWGCHWAAIKIEVLDAGNSMTFNSGALSVYPLIVSNAKEDGRALLHFIWCHLPGSL